MANSYRDESGVRIYTFGELMHRLKSPTWAVTKVGINFVFIPSSYRAR